jgi:hypothetical protein
MIQFILILIALTAYIAFAMFLWGVHPALGVAFIVLGLSGSE